MTRRGVEVQPLNSFGQWKRTREGRADANAGENVSVKINKTQYAIINSLREAGSFVPEAEVLPDTDLAEVLTNSGLDSAGLLIQGSLGETTVLAIANTSNGANISQDGACRRGRNHENIDAKQPRATITVCHRGLKDAVIPFPAWRGRIELPGLS